MHEEKGHDLICKHFWVYLITSLQPYGNTTITQEYNVETLKPEKKPQPLSKPTTRELLLLCENFYTT